MSRLVEATAQDIVLLGAPGARPVPQPDGSMEMQLSAEGRARVQRLVGYIQEHPDFNGVIGNYAGYGKLSGNVEAPTSYSGTEAAAHERALFGSNDLSEEQKKRLKLHPGEQWGEPNHLASSLIDEIGAVTESNHFGTKIKNGKYTPDSRLAFVVGPEQAKRTLDVWKRLDLPTGALQFILTSGDHEDTLTQKAQRLGYQATVLRGRDPVDIEELRVREEQVAPKLARVQAAAGRLAAAVVVKK